MSQRMLNCKPDGLRQLRRPLKRLLNWTCFRKRCFAFLHNVLEALFNPRKKTERCRKFSWVLCLLCLPDLTKIEFSWLNLVKIHKYKIPRKSAHWEPCFSVRTDRQTAVRTGILTWRCWQSLGERARRNVCLLILTWNATLHTRGFVKSSSTSLETPSLNCTESTEVERFDIVSGKFATEKYQRS